MSPDSYSYYVEQDLEMPAVDAHGEAIKPDR